MITAAQGAEPWISPGGAAILSGVVLTLIALITGIIELRKTRVTTAQSRDSTARVEHEMKPNHGGSLRDAVDSATAATRAIGGKLDKLSDMMHDVDKRLTRVETRTEWIAPPPVQRAAREAVHDGE